LTIKERWTTGIIALAATVTTVALLSEFRESAVILVPGLLAYWFGLGYLILQALFSREACKDHQIWASIIVSFVAIIITGFVIELSPLNLSAPAFAIILWIETIALIVIARRRLFHKTTTSVRGKALNGNSTPGVTATSRLRSQLSGFSQGLHNGLTDVSGDMKWSAALLATLGIIALSTWWAGTALIEASDPNPKPYTVLALQSDNGQNSDHAVSIFVKNGEGKAMRYRVELHNNGTLTKEWADITLDDGATRNLELPKPLAEGMEMEVLLFRQGESEPYRRVSWNS
jgi:hypothetical protein